LGWRETGGEEMERVEWRESIGKSMRRREGKG
jgi:hypothetical protein